MASLGRHCLIWLLCVMPFHDQIYQLRFRSLQILQGHHTYICYIDRSKQPHPPFDVGWTY